MGKRPGWSARNSKTIGLPGSTRFAMRYLSMVKLCGMSSVENVTRTRSSWRTSIRAGLNAYLWAEIVNLRSPPSCACARRPSTPSVSTNADQRSDEDVIVIAPCWLGEAREGSDPRTITRIRPQQRLRNSLLRFAGRRTARRRPCGSAFVLQQGLAAETNFAGGIDVDDLHQNLLALFQLITHIFHAMVRNFRHVQQPVSAGHNLDERAEICNPLHLAHVGLVELGGRRQLLDDADRFLGRRLVCRCDVYAAIILDIDLHAGPL